MAEVDRLVTVVELDTRPLERGQKKAMKLLAELDKESERVERNSRESTSKVLVQAIRNEQRDPQFELFLEVVGDQIRALLSKGNLQGLFAELDTVTERFNLLLNSQLRPEEFANLFLEFEIKARQRFEAAEEEIGTGRFENVLQGEREQFFANRTLLQLLGRFQELSDRIALGPLGAEGDESLQVAKQELDQMIVALQGIEWNTQSSEVRQQVRDALSDLVREPNPRLEELRELGDFIPIGPPEVKESEDLSAASAIARELCACLEQALRSSGLLHPGGGAWDTGDSSGGGFVRPAAFRFGDSPINGVRRDEKAVEDQAATWQAVLKELDRVPPALARTRQGTLDVDRAVRDLGFTFASAFEDAIVSGESLSDILQGLEDDILRILTRLLITEPLARGLTAGLGAFTGGGLGSGGGLEGVIGGGLGALANLFLSPVSGVGLGTYNKIAPIAAQDVANPLLAGVFQTGGPVHGPGGPTGDRIPALLSDGEFVVNAEAARRNRLMLEAINSNRLRRYVDGGGVFRTEPPEIPPRPALALPPAREPSFARRPVVININNPTSVPEIQRGMAQIRGSLREMLARAERRGE